MVRRMWTHEEIRAAADGNYAELMLSRRKMLGMGAAAAGAAFLGPFFPSAARAEVGGTLRMMTWQGYDMIQDAKGWLDENKVRTELATITAQDDVQAKFLGGSPVPIDLTEYNQAYNRLYVDELDIIRPLEMDKIPNYNKDDIFPGFYQTPLWYWDDTQWGVPFVWGLNSLVYNPAMMDKPTSYKDLLKPELAGLITITDEITGTWPIAARVAGLGKKYPNVTREELAEIFEVMKEYRAQCKTFSPSNGDIISLFVAGEIAACFNCWSGIPFEAAKQGVKLDYVIPEEGAVMWSDAWFTPRAGKNPDTAHAYINETLKPEYQAKLARDTTAGIVNRHAVPLMDEETRGLFDYDNLDAVFANSPLEGIPPRESEEFATYDDWVRAYEDLKIGL